MIKAPKRGADLYTRNTLKTYDEWWISISNTVVPIIADNSATRETYPLHGTVNTINVCTFQARLSDYMATSPGYIDQTSLAKLQNHAVTHYSEQLPTYCITNHFKI